MIDLNGGQIVVALSGGIAAGLIAWGAMRTELKFLWRDVSRLTALLDSLAVRLGVLERRCPSKRK